MVPRRACTMAVLGGMLLASGCAPAVAPAVPVTKARPPLRAAKQPAPPAADAAEGQANAKASPAPAKPDVRLSMRPAEATLEPGDLGVQLVVEGPGQHGGRRDLTTDGKWAAEPEGIVAVEPGGYVRPLKPGKATIRASFGKGLGTSEAVVNVAAEEVRPWDFAEEIVPIFTRFGCNTGGCHGRADGQNGFHLSLFGYDPEGDHQSLTRDASARRLSPMNPDDSLLLRKATGRTPHYGGMRLSANSDEYRTLRAWIAAGAPLKRGKTHGPLVSVTVEPSAVRLDEPGPQQLRVVAKYKDGHERDVTRLATYRVNDDTTASIDTAGKAVLLRRAETDLVVRYRNSVLSSRLATLINPDLSFDFASLPRSNEIDVELFKRLESLRVPPSPPASDAVFLRRVTLDLTGEQPEPDQIRKFLDDKDPDKRAKLVDALLASREFVFFWEIKLGDMLQINANRIGNGAYFFENWIHTQLEKNTPWDKLVYEMLTALGDPTDRRKGGPVNYALDGPDPKVKAEQAAQRFLGLRIRCAQCHDHPFDVWTQDDYFGLAAIFAKAEINGPMQPGAMMGKPLVKVNPDARVEHLRTKKPADPRLLDGTAIEVAKDEDPRKAFADWVTRPDNPYFARAMANWTWAQLFGKGIADPPDDLSRANPPVHPELLDALAKHFVDHHYDLRELIHTIVTSQAYALSSATVPGNEHDTRLFSHHMPSPLTAHQMADAIAKATDVPNYYRRGGTRVADRAIEVNDPNIRSTILETFGRCSRTNGCAAVAAPPLSLRQSLLLIGGDVIESKIASLNGYLANFLSFTTEPEAIVENLYLRTVCRPPTEDELKHWTNELKQASSTRDAAEDLFWALLNSREFAFNH